MILQSDTNSYDSLDETWSKGVINYPVGDGIVTIQIEDQDGKLAINGLVTNNNPQAIMIDRFYRLLNVMELDRQADPAELTAALIDWLDEDDTPYKEIHTDGMSLPVSGAEDLYYQSLSQPYHCKNGPLETLEELVPDQRVYPGNCQADQTAPGGEWHGGSEYQYRQRRSADVSQPRYQS